MSLIFSTQKLNAATLGGTSSLPPLTVMDNVQNMTSACLEEDDELFVGFGRVNTCFPYKLQNMYNREIRETEFRTAVLENEYLKAVFLPDMGGRLWSLFDKKAEKELLYVNEAVRPCNLAVRNAWVAGGIEYNIGVIGHGPFTCDTMFTARTALSDGTPVLRFYEYERIRGVVYQMDFFLPEASPTLFARMRIVNPRSEMVPMYWWTNIAVPGDAKSRNVINAVKSYHNTSFVISKCSVPYNDDGLDVTYPVNNPVAIDFFWILKPESRKYTAFIDDNGYGFVQHSTSRLKGRKLFVWGQGKGGARWQRFLTADGCDGKYYEIQAGLAKTQYECIPMPPNTAWEWLEGYSAIGTEPSKIHGDWSEAQAETEKALDGIITEEAMEELLKSTHSMAVSPAETLIYASGWGRLENIRREKAGEKQMTPYLDFGSTNEEQEVWLYLLENGNFSKSDDSKLPVSWMWQREWTELIKSSDNCCLKNLHLAAIRFAECEFDEALKFGLSALEFERSSAALFVTSQIYRQLGEMSAAADLAIELGKLMPDDISVMRQILDTILAADRYSEVIEIYESLSPSLKADGKNTLIYCRAILKMGDPQSAYDIMTANGGISVPDLREGDNTISTTYIEIMKESAVLNGDDFNAEKLQIPEKFDFRMQ